MVRSKPRGHPLRRWRQLDRREPVRRRPLARRDPPPEPDVDIVRGIWGADYDSDAVHRNYAAWGCSPPPPPSQRRD